MRWRTPLLRRRAASLRCSELVELVTAYLDDALPPSRRAAFDSHLERCVGCAAFLDQFKLTTRIVERLCDEPLPAELEGQLLELFHSWQGA
jgi:anti-sigma factor RsiW